MKPSPPNNHWATIQGVACLFHACAIATTLFRLAYRRYTLRFWWEDAWAAVALAFDIACFVGISWGHFDDPRVLTFLVRMFPLAFTCILWAARMSMIFSILRVANPKYALRWIVNGIIASFAIMWIVLLVQKVQLCEFGSCNIGLSVIIAITVTDTTSDLMLVIIPIYLLRGPGFTRRQRILVTSTFYASLLITAISITHAALLSVNPFSDATLIFGHVKSATALIIANLLVIVTFAYRHFRGPRAGLDVESRAEFTTIVDLGQATVDSSCSAATAVLML